MDAYNALREFQVTDGDELLFKGNILECFEWLQVHPVYVVNDIGYYIDSIEVYLR